MRLDLIPSCQAAAFIVFHPKKTNTTAMTFAETLLKDAQVAVVPGHVFGPSGDGYFRSCIATNFDDLKTAAKKIQAFVS